MDIFELLRTNEKDFLSLLDITNINVLDYSGTSLLQEAIRIGKTEIAMLLIDKGADIDYADNKHLTALHFAISHSNNDISLYLISSGCNVNKKDEHGNNALWAAVMNANVSYEVITKILEAGGDVNSENVYGKTPLDMVIKMDVPGLSNLFGDYINLR